MRFRHLSVLAAVTALLTSPVQAHAAQPGHTYHVAPAGSDHAHGTQARPCAPSAPASNASAPVTPA